MSSKEAVLNAIRKSKPEKLESPVMDFSQFSEDIQVLSNFKSAVEKAGGSVIKLPHVNEVNQQIHELFPGAGQRYSALEGSEAFNSVEPEKLWYPHELEGLDLLILKGDFGVAENGAVWLTEAHMPIRVMPFITKHLVLVINADKLVGNMHDAYARIADQHTEFGLFLSGPSKTADIEQTLVIGAQGALSLHVVLVTGY
jgi:L-lactate dehydrogenase complex protein LldG